MTYSIYLLNKRMTDITDDIAEEISFQSFEDDCKLLGNLLHDVLQHDVGNDIRNKLERIRILAQVITLILFTNFTRICEN